VSNNNQERKQVFLGSLHYDATEKEIVDAFAGIGVTVTNVRIPRDNDTGRSKGFAFVDIDPGVALSIEEIISGIDGVAFRGRPCRADKVKASGERRERSFARPEKPRRRGTHGKAGRDGEDW
jgi:RNA recognition motif-containing protein